MATSTHPTVQPSRFNSSFGRLRLLRSDWAKTAIAQFGLLSLGLVSGIASGRLLGPEGRGHLAVVTLWPLALVYLASAGLNHSIVFHTGKRQHSISQIWTAVTFLGSVQSLLVTATGLILMPVLLRHYDGSLQRLGFLFLLATPAIIFSTYPPNVLVGAGDMSSFNILRVIAPGCYTMGLVVLIALKKPSLPAVVSSQAAGYIVVLAAGLIVLYRRENPAFVFRWHVSRSLLGYGVKAHFANLTSYLNQRVDQLVLTLLIPARELGLYAIAVALSMALSFLPVAVGMVTFARGAAQSNSEARRTLNRSFRASALWLLAGGCALYFAAPFLINLLLGPRFAGSVLACRLLLPGTVALGLNQVLYSGANAMGKPSLPSYAEGVGLAVTAIGLILLAPRYGYLGAAVVSSIAYIVSFVVMLILARAFMQLGFRELIFSNFKRERKVFEVVVR